MDPKGLYFDDLQIGQTFTTDRRTISETDHVQFTTAFGFFEPLFMDRAYVANQTPYGRPIVPGALTFSVAEGLTILRGILHGTGIAFLGVEMEVRKPVHIGDTLKVIIEVVDKRETRKTHQGIVTYGHKVINQEEETVMAYRIKRMIRRKS